MTTVDPNLTIVPSVSGTSSAERTLKKEGFLWKRARGRSKVSLIHKPWALRWFTFRNGTLQYFKEGGLSGRASKRLSVRNLGSMSAPSTPALTDVRRNSLSLKGQILIDPNTAVVGKDMEQGKQFAFYVSNCRKDDGSYETLSLAATSEEEMAQWMFVFSGGKSKVLTGIGIQVPRFEPVELRRAISRHAPRIKDLYEIHERLGSGGFSVVKRGADRETGDIFALKLIQNSVFHKNQERTEAECQVLASLDHPGIVKLREVVRTNKFFVIVMELLEGGDMFDRLVQKRKYHENDAKVIAAHILDAVRYLHSNDIVHRDLKPENIIFDKRGDDAKLKLTDFGFATMYDPKNKLTATCGTPEYVAPEVLEEKTYDSSVDMWSCGVVFYILLCGFPPFYGETEDILFDRICRARYHFVRPHWDIVSNNAKDLIKHLLELDPKKRFTAQQALEHAWFADIVSETTGDIDRTPTSTDSADLGQVLGQLRRYNAFRKLRKGVLAVIAVNKMRTAFHLGEDVDFSAVMGRLSTENGG